MYSVPVHRARRYVNDPEHLRIAMIQLRNPNKALQLAVFNVLKVFIPNPFKGQQHLRTSTSLSLACVIH